jgi:DNA polymerase-3 subunit gamma/tau
VSLALYRRYRPETFAEVIGQEHVTEPLQQAIRNGRVNHAYLFSGPRGCGKTTSARILARALNCEQGPTPTPCGQCRSCLDLARGGGGGLDVVEIDAASHGGVDDARDLRDRVAFAPASARYKVYIIDEAHMVTTAGFNALLKVVEEPPEHVKFIFATTEPEKVIATIRSRTHHYPFRLVPPGVLRGYLATLCEKENVQVEPAVLPLVVRAGAGSVRDSLSVLDQLIAGAPGGAVTLARATALLGYTDAALLDDVVDAFAAHDGAAVFELVDRVIEGGHDPRRFVQDLLERLRDLVILAAVPDAGGKGLIDAPEDRLERMRAQAAQFGPAEVSRAADLVNAGLTEMRGATAPRLQLELICARVLLPGAGDGERDLHARLDRLERRVAAGVAPTPSTAAPGPGRPRPRAAGSGPARARRGARRPRGPRRGRRRARARVGFGRGRAARGNLSTCTCGREPRRFRSRGPGARRLVGPGGGGPARSSRGAPAGRSCGFGAARRGGPTRVVRTGRAWRHRRHHRAAAVAGRPRDREDPPPVHLDAADGRRAGDQPGLDGAGAGLRR